MSYKVRSRFRGSRDNAGRRTLLRVGALTSLFTLAAASACEPAQSFDDEEIGSTQQAATSTKPVLVNQLGYATKASKVAVIQNSSTSAGTAKVFNSAGGEVWSGATVYRAADANSGDAVHHADFSTFTTAGTNYEVRITIGGTTYLSEKFDISDSLYGDLNLGKGAIKFFTWKRSGMAVPADAAFNIFGHGVSHTGDSALSAYKPPTAWRAGTFDVAGGWYDAGDFGKYMESHTAATFYLANMFERLKGVADPAGRTIDGLDLGFTEGTLPDVLAEIAWGTRWVRGAMPDPTTHKGVPARIDLVANKCTGEAWAQWVNYDADPPGGRYCMGPSTSATHSAARNMAQVSRLLSQYPSATTIVDMDGVTDMTATVYADKLWTAAKEAFGRATGKHADYADYTGAGASNMMLSDLIMTESPGFNQGSGAYGDEDMRDDEYAAAVELYLTACQRNDATAVAKYKPLVTGHSYYKVAGPCDWGSERELGDPDGEEAGCGTLSLLTAHDLFCTAGEALPPADIAAMKTNLATHSDGILANMNGQNYPFYAQDGGQVVWGSNAANAGNVVMMTAAYEYSGNRNYLRGAARLADYLLGTNPNKISYVIGFGEGAEEFTHDRAMKATGGWVKGTLVGGPHNLDGNFQALATRWGGSNNIDDNATPDQGFVLRRYVPPPDDGAGSWECKENAVNWNAALANAIWSLQVRFDEMGCASGAECNDGSNCTTDSCVGGVCQYAAANEGSACTSDGSSCTDDLCASGVCTHPVTTSCGGGTGLKGEYFTGIALAGSPVLTRTDATVNFNWVAGSPAPLPVDNFSVRWSGQVKPLYTGLYTFTESSDDGGRLWVNGQQVINKWEDGAAAAESGTITLTAGQPYDITYEFYEATGDASASLQWSSAGQAQQVIPQSQLFPAAGGATCSDGIQNQGETGIDCGGPCSACAGGCVPADCNDGDPCTSDICNAGTCSHPPAANGTACSDSNACTQSDTCQSGTCSGANPVVCTASDQCHDVGTCNTGTGVCSNPNKANGTACSDSNACTQSDTCQSGTCSGANPVVCTASDQCHDVGTCNTGTGVCSNPNKANGTACNDGNAGTCNDVCTSGSCGGGTCGGGGNDPRVLYNFNETSGTTAADSSGNALNATLSGATFVAGYSGNAVRIAGGTQRVNLPANVAQNCTDATGFTMAARVRLTTNSTNWSRIVDIGTGTSSYMFLSPRAGGSSTLRFAMKLNGGTEQVISYSYSFPLNTWKHLAVTLSGTTGRLYLDGAQVGQNTAMNLDPSSFGATANNWLGDSQFSGDPQLDGTIDDFRIACRTYSATEISDLAGSGCTLPAAPGSPGATGGTEQVSLSWPAVSGATSYTVRRSATSGGPYTDVATGVSSTAYVNTVAAGTYYYVIAAVNSCGTGANSSQISGVSTNAAPTANISSPSSGATFTAPASITINATAADTSFGSINRVEFYNGAALLGSDTSSPYSYAWSGVVAGSYSLTAKAVDNLGAVTTSTAVSVTVNTCTLPAAPASAPAATGGTEQVSLSWSSVSGATSYTVRRSATSGGPYTDVATGVAGTSNVNAVAAGTYYYVIAAVNSCGTGANSSQGSGVSTNAAPTANISSPSSGATFTAPASITINATAADTSFGSINRVEFYNGAALLGSDTSSPYSYAWSGVVAGSYSLTAKAVDNLGAVTTSTAVGVTVSGGGGGGPCDGLCANPTIITALGNSGDLGSGAVCRQYTGTLGGGNYGNFVAPRALTVNGVLIGSAGGNISLPAPRNGGYCFQANAGSHNWAYFGIW